MYCKNCNNEIGEFRYCTHCGADNGAAEENSYTQHFDNTQNDYSYMNNHYQEDPGKGSALASMILGICSLAGVGGIITAILAIVFAKNYSKHGNSECEIYAKAGRITGIISLILNIIIILAVIAYFVFIVLFMSAGLAYPEYYFY